MKLKLHKSSKSSIINVEAEKINSEEEIIENENEEISNKEDLDVKRIKVTGLKLLTKISREGFTQKPSENELFNGNVNLNISITRTRT